MNRRSRRAGQLATLALVGLLVVAFPAGFALAQDLADPGATTQSNHTLVPIINLTSTPTETPTPTTTQTATSTPPSTATPTPTSGGDDGGGGDTSADGRRLVVDKGTGTTGGVAADEDCSNAEYTKIQPAVDDAAPGDTVVVCASSEPYRPASTIEIDRANLTLMAYGDAVIETNGYTAIRTTAPGITIRGITFDHTDLQSQRFAVEVGGRATMIQNNTINLTANSSGIFLSDGLMAESGEPDPDLGAATGSQVINNTVYASDQTRYGVFIDADQTTFIDNTLFPREDASTTILRSSGNDTVIRNNLVDHINPCKQGVPIGNCIYRDPPAIEIGKVTETVNSGENPCRSGPEYADSKHESHNWAQNNRFVNNSVSESPGTIYIIGPGVNKTENKTVIDIPKALKGAVVRNNTLSNTGGLAVFSNGAVIRDNTVYANNSYTGDPSNPKSGGSEGGICSFGHNIRIFGNFIKGHSLGLGPVAGQNITITRNIVTTSPLSQALFVDGRPYGTPGWNATAINISYNTVSQSQGDNFDDRPNTVSLWGAVNVTEFSYNNITNNRAGGVEIRPFGDNATISHFHHNTITRNNGDGIVIFDKQRDFFHPAGGPSNNVSVTKLHHNVIDNNQGLGIYRVNRDKTDDKWPILNATHNIWGCGGPSGGLRDPYTNRTANGSGDGLSAGDESGVSNIHFDPFYVRQDVDCPAAMSNPTPTPTPTATPSPTLTPPPAGGNDTGGGGDGGTGSGNGSGDGGSDGSGAGSGDGDGAGSGDSGAADSDASSGDADSSGDRADTATPPPTPPTESPTATSSPTPTQSPSPTLSPTPVVEPGFGVNTWLVGVAILFSLLAARRRTSLGGERHD